MSWHIEDSQGKKREIAMAEDNEETSREQTETRMFGELVEEMRKNLQDDYFQMSLKDLKIL